jgi:hypothetical protein
MTWPLTDRFAEYFIQYVVKILCTVYCVYKTNFYSPAYTIVQNHLHPEGARLWEVYCTIIIALCYCERWFGQTDVSCRGRGLFVCYGGVRLQELNRP